VKKGLLLGLVVLLALCVAAVGTGSVSLTWAEIGYALVGRDPTGMPATMVWLLRIPRMLLALLVGASLSCAGAAFQALLRSPLADPYLIGTSAGASLGTVLAIVLGVSPALHPVVGFLGAVGAVLWVSRLSRVRGVLLLDDFLLAGVMMSTFLGSLVSLLLSLAGGQEMGRILFFLLGDLSEANWDKVTWPLPLLLTGVALLAWNAYPLNLLSLGEDFAAPAGVPVEKVKLHVLLGAALLTACAVSAAGMVGFVGLVVPHLCRFWSGPDLRKLLPLCLVWGGAFLLACDLLVQVGPVKLPVGVVTSLLGAPWFLWQLQRQRRERLC
jgi:iron complex transport system permease protein